MLRIAALVACVASASAFAPGAMSARSHRQPLSGFIAYPLDAAAPSLCPQMPATARADAQWACVSRPMQLKGATSTCKLPVAAARPAVIRATVAVNNFGRRKVHSARCRLPPGIARARHQMWGAALVDGLLRQAFAALFRARVSAMCGGWLVADREGGGHGFLARGRGDVVVDSGTGMGAAGADGLFSPPSLVPSLLPSLHAGQDAAQHGSGVCHRH